MTKHASLGVVTVLGALLSAPARAHDLSPSCEDEASESERNLDTAGTDCKPSGADGATCTFFRASLDPGKRQDPVGAACQIILGYAGSDGCTKVQRLPYGDGTALRILNPWGDAGGNLTVTREMLVSLLCAYDHDYEDTLLRTCEREVAAYNGVACKPEAEDPS